jgi:Host cell surface-exposed lipoprotein
MTESPPNPISPQRSADGLWEWNGTQWIAAQPPPGAQQVAQSAPLGQYPPQVPVKKKGHMVRNVGIVVGALLLVGIGGAIASSGGSNNNSTGTTTASSPAVTAAATAKATAAATAKAAPAAPAGPTLTNQQQNAVRSAREYLNLTAFSRQGLIDQLSSAYGSGYSVNDATIAVDSLNVDWNAEAAQSAKEYLKLTAFSCNGLIQQLDSPYGGKFTVAQATYGAQQAGAC